MHWKTSSAPPPAPANCRTCRAARCAMTAPEDVGRLLIAPIVARFMRGVPDIDLDVVLTPRNVDLVQEGFDLAVRVGRLADSSLVARRWACCASACSPRRINCSGRARRRRCAIWVITVAWIFAAPAWRDAVAPGRSRRPEDRGRGARLNADSLSYLETLIASGAGIGPLPLYAGGVARANARCRAWCGCCPITPPAASPALVTPTARFVPKRVRLLIDMLTDAIRPRAGQQRSILSRPRGTDASSSNVVTRVPSRGIARHYSPRVGRTLRRSIS